MKKSIEVFCKIRMYFGIVNTRFELINSENKTMYAINSQELGYTSKTLSNGVLCRMAKSLAEYAKKNNIYNVEVYVSGANNSGREDAIRQIQKTIFVKKIKDVVFIPHNAL